MSELREADRPPTPEPDFPQPWESAGTDEPKEPKAAESSTAVDDHTTGEQTLEQAEQTESADVEEPVGPEEAPLEPGEWGQPEGSAESGEQWEVGEPEEPTEPWDWGSEEDVDGLQPEAGEPGASEEPEEPEEPEALEESSEPEEPEDPEEVAAPEEVEGAGEDLGEEDGEGENSLQPEGSSEPEEPEDPEEVAAPEEVEGAGEDLGEEDGEGENSLQPEGSSEPEEPEDPEEVAAPEEVEGAGEDLGEEDGEGENSLQPEESSEPEEPEEHDAEGDADGFPPVEENPESAESPDIEQLVEDAEPDESVEPGDSGDSGDKIQETVDRPLIENMYFEKGHEVIGLTYGDPINENPAGRTPLFDGPPTREQAAQGRLSDCGLIATIGAVAGHRPEAIENAVRENPDGTYTVALHDTAFGTDGVYRATERRIELLVKPDLPVVESNPNVPAFAALRGSAWGAVLEKSMAGVDQTWGDQRRENWEATWQANPKAQASDGPIPAGYERLNQGAGMWAQAEILTQLTGQDSAVYPFPKGEGAGQALESHLRQQLTDDKPVVAATRPLDQDAGETGLSHYLVANHVYEVVGAQDGMVFLRNPWNMSHPEPIKTEEFMENFSYKEWGFYATLT